MTSTGAALRVPVVLFGYNRPDHLRQTLTALAAAEGAEESPLWIFCDGPKAGQSANSVEAVRAVADEPCWPKHFASVEIIAAECNQGLANSIIGGVTRVLEDVEAVIVLEDDLIVAPDFLVFMNDCLAFYRDDKKVGSVTGFCPLKVPPAGYAHDVMAVPRNCSHGWATWDDRWREVDWEAREADRIWCSPAMQKRFNATGTDRVDRLRRQLSGQIDSWSIRFGLWQLLSTRHTIYPIHNRVRNIGFDGSGVHTRDGQQINDEISGSLRTYKLSRPDESPAVLSAFRRVYSGHLLGRLKRGFVQYFFIRKTSRT